MSDQAADDGFESWWRTLQADPRRPTAVATMSKKTARAGWNACLAACEARLAEAEAKGYEQALIDVYQTAHRRWKEDDQYSGAADAGLVEVKATVDRVRSAHPAPLPVEETHG